MTVNDNVFAALNKMILSASGWRGIFAKDGGEESASEEIPEEHRIICGAAAHIFKEYLTGIRNQGSGNGECKPLVLLGADTRPTGKAIIEAMIPILLDLGCEIKYAGAAAAPEIMAWARSYAGIGDRGSGNITGFIYVSASHNPIGHNGLKFGLTDGGVLAADEARKLIDNFRIFIENSNNIKMINSFYSAANQHEPEFRHRTASSYNSRLENIENFKNECFNAYYNFCDEAVWGGSSSLAGTVKESLAKKPLGIVCDFNGSARTVSIDKKFFNDLGLRFECINAEPGQIAHRIVPEGESLEPCRRLLEDSHSKDRSFMLGYVPDCDGDRGNLVIFDDILKKARALEAQEVFALACVAELSHLVWVCNADGKTLPKTAIAVNDPTSMRIDTIAKAFGVSVFRAEVGEANVVGLARKLREEGYIVRILGEGSAGGNITHPSAVRDPLNTVLAIAKLLSVRGAPGKPGLFELWCKLAGQTLVSTPELYRDDFSLADIIASLPPYISTPAYSQDAVLRIKTSDHSALKDRYQQIFLREWEKRKNDLKARFDIHDWEAIAYNGMRENRDISRFGDAGKGGLKISFKNSNGETIAYIWMRGSATEPVFRIMVDAQAATSRRIESNSLSSPTEGRHAQGEQTSIERELIEWQRCMIMEADNG